MKKMTCVQLEGACELELRAETFDEMAELSRRHGMEMYQKGDPDHLRAMEKMGELMADSEQMAAWLDARRAQFDALPEEEA